MSGRRLTRAALEAAIAAFCREVGFRIDAGAPSHVRALDRAVKQTMEAGR